MQLWHFRHILNLRSYSSFKNGKISEIFRLDNDIKARFCTIRYTYLFGTLRKGCMQVAFATSFDIYGYWSTVKWGNAVHPLAPRGSLSLQSSAIQHPLLRDGSAHSGSGPPTRSINQEKGTQISDLRHLMEAFSRLRVPLPRWLYSVLSWQINQPARGPYSRKAKGCNWTHVLWLSFPECPKVKPMTRLFNNDSKSLFTGQIRENWYNQRPHSIRRN